MVRIMDRGTAWLFFAWVVLALLMPVAAGAGQESGEPAPRLGVEGISASLGEDEPRVLYILPWQAPSLSKRPRAELDDRAPELLAPVDPLALERHRVFRENLNPLILSPFAGPAGTEQSFTGE